jgi:hypothetical protein
MDFSNENQIHESGDLDFFFSSPFFMTDNLQNHFFSKINYLSLIFREISPVEKTP